MPIIVPKTEHSDLHKRLVDAKAAVLSQEQAEHQDIRPARIALLNLMPAVAMEKTETQWLRYISHSVLQIEPILIKFNNDYRERNGASRSDILSRYIPFSEAVDIGVDGLIITGDNLELKDSSTNPPTELPLNEIRYATELTEIIEWARSNVRSTIYSCLASHFALNSLYGVKREIGYKKIFGVYEHDVNISNNELIAGMDDVIRAPHSRWGNVPEIYLQDTPVEVLAVSSLAGWLLATDSNKAGGKDIFIQGHPEYDRNDLMQEHKRDAAKSSSFPADYYDQHGKPRLTWANDARALHSNWINYIYQSFA